MVIECCSQERSYSNFYGLVGERFCRLNRVWFDCFESAFGTYYDTIHRYETNRLRNIARLFGHLLANDALSWNSMSCIKLTEEDTTSSSRIFVKIMLGEVQESMGLKVLKERFADQEVKSTCAGMFPLDNPKNTRFAINYFTSIGLGAITEEMREYLKVCNSCLNHEAKFTDYDRPCQNAPRLIMEQRRALEAAEGSSSSDSDSDDSSSDDSSDSDSGSSDHSHRKSRHRNSTPPRPSRYRGESRTPRRRGDSRDRSHDRRSPVEGKNNDRSRETDGDYSRGGSSRRYRERTRTPPSSRSRSPRRRSRTPPRRYRRDDSAGDSREDYRRR
jgi:pre-mRNA-splicing factor CWC22